MSSLSERAPAIFVTVASESDPAVEAALARAEWQQTVFAERPRRVALLALQPRWALRSVRVSLLRNHAVEPVLALLKPFLAYSGLEAVALLSAYDDSLSAPPASDADVHIVWLDPSRYAGSTHPGAVEALAGRLRELRGVLRGALLLVDAPLQLDGASPFNAMLREAAERIPDAHLVPCAAITSRLGASAVEARAEAIGTHISGEAAVLVAQHLGLHWIPAMLRPRLKAVVADLDNTLIGGVLREDGAEGVVTDGGYARVRERLLQLHEQGVLLALVTKNDPADVERLFEQRAELSALRRAFAVVGATWQPKAETVRAIAARLHITVDSVLVVDDNPGEVVAMAASLRDTSFVLAGDPYLTARALTLHPGLLEVRADELGSRRAADLLAAKRRAAELQQAADAAQYVRSLQMVARLSMNAEADLRRLSELSRKTNQFNTGLVRFNETDVDRYMKDPAWRIVSIRLRDRLSDSGVIGVVFAHVEGDAVVIDEIGISCRALGRFIEDVLIDAAITTISAELRCARALIRFTAGPRNEPAREWLDRVADPVGDGCYEYAPGREAWLEGANRASIDVRWEDARAQ